MTLLDEQRSRPSRGTESEALIEEARLRQRKRRLSVGIVALVVVVTSGAWAASTGGSTTKPPKSTTPGHLKSPTPGGAPKSSSPQSLRAVLTGTFRPAGGIYGVTTGGGAAWATTGNSLLRIGLGTDKTVPVLSLPAASLATVVYGAGSIWVSDNAGILRVDPHTGKVTGTARITASSLSFGEGALWTVEDSALVRIDPRTLAIQTFRLPVGKPVGKTFGFAAGAGAVWVSVTGSSCAASCLLRIDPSSGRIVARVEAVHLFGLVATGDGAVWVSDGTSVVRINPRTNRVVTTLGLLPALPGSGDSRTTYGSGLLATSPGAVWVTKTINGHGARLVQIDPLNNRVVGRGTAVGPYPSAIAAAGYTVWLATGNEALTRVDLVACGQDGCRPPAPPPSRLAPVTPLWFESLQMVSPRTGWAIRWTENPGVLDSATLAPTRTTDGGRTWTDVTPAAARSLLIATRGAVLFALNAERAWLVISSKVSTVFVTSDGGRNWTHSPPIHGLGEPSSLDFVDVSHGWMMEDLGAAMGSDPVAILRTTDGGMTWSLVARTPPLFGPGTGKGGLPLGCGKTGVAFATPSLGWVSGVCNGGGPFLYATRDGGRTWAAQYLPVPAASCGGCDVSPPVFFGQTGFLSISTASGAVLLVTHDTGATWSRVPLPAHVGRFPRMQFVDARHGFLIPAGPDGSFGHVLYATANAGRTWTRVRSNVRLDHIGTPDFVSAEVGVASFVGGDVLGVPPLYATTNGGRTWTRFTPTLEKPRS